MAATDDQDKMLQLDCFHGGGNIESQGGSHFSEMMKIRKIPYSNIAVAQVGLSEKYIHAGTAHAVKISPQLLKDGYMYFRDATTDKRLMNHKAKKAEGIGSILSVPVMDKGRMLGILSLYTKDIRKFTKDEIDFLSILAEQGGSAIENRHT